MNSVIVQARPRDLEEIATLINDLDQGRPEAVTQIKVFALENAVAECQGRLAAGQRDEALAALLPLAHNRRMEDALGSVLEQVGRPDAEPRLAKRLAEYDYLSLRRL